ncbi:hypothetical protein N9051_01740 [Akkermansiaceae bacterium]|nr:hypothetical protein [Akkermansiaceae bacterium]
MKASAFGGEHTGSVDLNPIAAPKTQNLSGATIKKFIVRKLPTKQ